MFRAKLAAVVTAQGSALVNDSSACDLAVVSADAPDAVDRIRGWVAGGTRVLAYGAHVRADLLRAARDAGADAVPNSEVERRLLELLTST